MNAWRTESQPLRQLFEIAMIELLCPKCKRLMTVDASKAGKIGRCLKCNQKFRVPSDLSHEEEPSTDLLPSLKGLIHPGSIKRAADHYPAHPPKTDEEITRQSGYVFEEQPA